MRSAVGLSIESRARAVCATDAGTAGEDDRPVAVGLTEAGEVVVGEGALTLAPPRRATTFVDEFGRPEPFIVAGAPYGAEALLAQMMRALVDGLTAGSGAADEIAFAYADDLDAYRLDLIQQAARLAAVGDVRFVPNGAARAYADDLALGAALWALDVSRSTTAGAPPATGTPVTARTALVGSGVVAGGAGAGAAVGAGAAEVAGSAAAGFGAGTSMADFGPDMGDFRSRGGRNMKAFAAAAVLAAVVIGAAATVFATRGGGGGNDDVNTADAVTTIATEPDLDDPVAVAEALDGSFQLTTTVIDGNPSHPVGKTETFTLAITTSCAGDECEVDIERIGSAPLAAGGEVRFAGSANEPCTNDPSITVAGSYELRLRVTGFDADGNVSRIEGTNDQTITDLAGCPDTEIDPIKLEWVLTRV